MNVKKYFFRCAIFLCIMVFGFACSRSEKLVGNEFLIEGELSGVEDGIEIRLLRWEGESGTLIASDTIRNGRFMFKEETIVDVERLTLNSRYDGFPSMYLNVWITPGAKIKIKGKGKIHPLWEVKSSVPYQKEENRYTNNSRDLIEENSRLSVESAVLRTKARTADSNDEALTYKAAADSLAIIHTSLMIKLFLANMDFMIKSDISPVWLDKLFESTNVLRIFNLGIPLLKNIDDYEDEFRKKAEALYSRMSEKDKTTPIGYRITVNIFPLTIVEVGDYMADADLLDVNGNTKRISDYSGKYLLLDFWSIGCGPCIAAIPEMKEISETYRDKLTIISISLDNNNNWKEAMTEHDMPWVNIRDPKAIGGLAANYGFVGMPFYVMISPEGKVVDIWTGYDTGYLKEKVSENIK